MVNNSELAFRLLVRQYGVQLTYTPMINAKAFIQLETEEERKLLVEPHPLDRPLIVQFCSDDPDELLAAALKLFSFKTVREAGGRQGIAAQLSAPSSFLLAALHPDTALQVPGQQPPLFQSTPSFLFLLLPHPSPSSSSCCQVQDWCDAVDLNLVNSAIFLRVCSAISGTHAACGDPRAVRSRKQCATTTAASSWRSLTWYLPTRSLRHVRY
eukprot:2103267-Rhodomonas_salina.4